MLPTSRQVKFENLKVGKTSRLTKEGSGKVSRAPPRYLFA